LRQLFASASIAGAFFVTLEKQSPCKVNLLLNILGKRPDGFHELETVMHPVNLFDRLTFRRAGVSVQLTCSDPALPVDGTNLVHRAATTFREAAGIKDGVAIHLEKHIPMAAGLGGGSGNAATTLLGLNELFGHPLPLQRLHDLAASIGSDVPFFLQNKPAIATGRGEKIQAVDFFAALKGAAFLLIHPGFGVATAWAYQNLARFPEALNGRPGRAENLVRLLNTFDLKTAAGEFYNSLEAPVLEKYPLLEMYQQFLGGREAVVALMSGSGSTTFGIFTSEATARQAGEKMRAKFGPCWVVVVGV
jgi:4-diphosphocytidyl-2-C-methyl-D-erythritol kinase